MGASVRTVGAALRGRPAWDSVLGYRRVAEIEFDAGRPRRAAPTVRPVGLDRRGVFVGEAKVSRSRWSIWPHTPCFVAGMTVAKHPDSSDSLKGKQIMKKLVSFALGAVVLFGAATFGLQSATANAKDRHDQNYWRHHRRHHKHHKHWQRNHLSY